MQKWSGIGNKARSGRGTGVLFALGILALALGAGGCGGDKGSNITVTEIEGYKVTFPDLVPFHPEEWTTSADYAPIGDPRAKRDLQDRPFVRVWDSFPPTLRLDGPNSNLVTSRTVQVMMYESLVGLHPETMEDIPQLASHWKIESNPDGKTQTFWYRINEKARFSDGSEVTADDVQATWWHLTQKDRKAPSNYIVFGEGYEEPEVIDKYTIKVKTKKLGWRLFLYFSGMLIRPAKYLRIPGDQFLEEYNWKYMPGTGPYHLANASDLKKGDSLTITRRTDWWAENERWAKNTYNFGKLKFFVVRDREIEYEQFKNGDLDFFQVGRAQRWVQDIPQEKIVQMGWVQRRKIYNEAPEGFAGFAFNMRKPPFDDKRVRLAFCHLFNREKLFERLFFNEYDYIDSYFPGRDWGDPEHNEKIRFDPDRAEELLAEAGYKDRDEDGYLLGADGKRLEVTLRYGVQAWERIWLVVKEDYENAGVKFNLELLDASTLQKKIEERQFLIHFQSWSALDFPNPETSWRSDFAYQNNNNNIPGFKSERVDELLKVYDVTFDRAKQKDIVREIDRTVFKEHPYALGWYAGFNRILYWDKYGHPDSYFTRIGQFPHREAMQLWWFDTEKEAAMLAAKKEGKAIPQGEMIVKPWAKKD